MGTLNSAKCNDITKTMSRNNWLTASHIPKVLNTEADYKSRRNKSGTEWKLLENIYDRVVSYFHCKPDIDVFASRINNQVDKFVSYQPDPHAFAVDAFSMDWQGLNFYAFPPFSCVRKC